MNAAPQILPVLRNWSGGEGFFRLTKETRLVNPPRHIPEQCSLLLGVEPLCVTASVDDGEIRFFEDASLVAELGNEGYSLVATEKFMEIRAASSTGLFYGGITVLQGIYASGSSCFPCGSSIDIPAYPVRSGMLDVARAYVPMEKLYEIGRYMAWFKMNELHLHINDTGKHGYSAFRLESEVPGLTSTDGSYSKEEYKAFQKEMLSYGIKVVTEIDSPYHASCYANALERTPLFLTTDDNVPQWCVGICLDIRYGETVAFIKDLFIEYLSGDDPVFLAKTVHIGMDEYPASMKTDMTAYLEEIVAHVNAYGYTARFWSGLAPGGCMNPPCFSSDAKVELSYWDFGLSGPAETVSCGYPVVNSINAYLYVVPGNAEAKLGGYTDGYFYKDYQLIYQRWQANLFSLYAEKKELLPADDPMLLGASFSIWNDNHSAHLGLTYRDVISRLPGSVCITAEKTWCGTETASIPFEEYFQRFSLHKSSFFSEPPLGNDEIIEIDFSSGSRSEGFTVVGEPLSDGLLLDGSAYLSHVREYVGFPLTLELELELSEQPAAKTALFASADKSTELVIYPDGTVGIDAKVTEQDFYHFTFPYRIRTHIRSHLTFRCDGRQTVLCADGITYPCINDREHLISQADLPKGRYNTLTVSLWRIGRGIKGKLYSIKLYNTHEKTTEDYV